MATRDDPRARAAALRVLGLRAGATHAQVVAAYRRAARATHPDRSDDPGAAERFAAVAAAYRQVLREPGIPAPAVPRHPEAEHPQSARPSVRSAPLVAGPVYYTPYRQSSSSRQDQRRG